MRPTLSPAAWAWLTPSSASPANNTNEPRSPAPSLELRLTESAELARRDLLDLVLDATPEAIDHELARARDHFAWGDALGMYDVADAMLGVDDPDPEVRGHARALVRQWVVLDSLSGPSVAPDDLRIRQGRHDVATRARPPIARAIETVLNGQARSISEIVAALDARAWLPRAANPRAYVSQILASRTDRFRRVRRGTYAPV